MAIVCGITELNIGRKFWATQPDACGSEDDCGVGCGIAGLSYDDSSSGGSIATDDYIRGLAINILMTNGRREDNTCGYKPGTRGGHWSDSFRKDGLTSGSRVRYVPTSYSINETVGLIRSYVQSDMQKLVTMGVAVSVDVDVKYAGNNRISCDITINGYGDTSTRVGVTGTRITNGWTWDSDG